MIPATMTAPPPRDRADLPQMTTPSRAEEGLPTGARFADSLAEVPGEEAAASVLMPAGPQAPAAIRFGDWSEEHSVPDLSTDPATTEDHPLLFDPKADSVRLEAGVLSSPMPAPDDVSAGRETHPERAARQPDAGPKASLGDAPAGPVPVQLAGAASPQIAGATAPSAPTPDAPRPSQAAAGSAPATEVTGKTDPLPTAVASEAPGPDNAPRSEKAAPPPTATGAKSAEIVPLSAAPPVVALAPGPRAAVDPLAPLPDADPLGAVSSAPSAPGTAPAAPGAPMPAAQPAPPAVQQIALSLSAANDGTVEVALTPEELGTVRLRIEGREGAWVVTILSDRPETLDILRRSQSDLAAAFAEAGYDNPAFNFDRGQGQRDDTRREQTLHAGLSASADPAAPPPPPPGPRRAAGLDLKL